MLKSITWPLLLALSFSFVNPCSPDNKSTAPSSNDTIHQVQTVKPTFKSVSKTYKAKGEFTPSELTYITANARGTIEQIYVDVGDRVSKDDPITAIANNQIIEMIDIKRSRIAELQARLDQAQGRVADADGEDLPTTIEDTMFMDEDPIDEPTANKNFGDSNTKPESPRTVKGMIDILETTIARLTKEASALDRQMLDLVQNSPVSGVVTAKLVSDNNLVKPQDKLIEIAQTNPLSVTFKLPDNIASYVDKNSKVKVFPTDAPEFTGSGTVYYINPNIDQASKTIEIKAHISNPDNRIKGGQQAEVTVSTRKTDRVIVLPKEVLHQEDNKTYVFIVYRNKAKLVQVTTGEEDEQGNVQIFGDLRVDDPIIIKRPPELKHNSFIKVVTAEELNNEVIE